MTWRAVVIGLIAAWFIAGFGYVNDWVLDLERFTAGRLLPVIVLGPMLLGLLLLNPLLFRLRRAWVLRPAEIGLIVVLACAACSICGGGLMDHLLQTLVLPHHWNRVTPGWKERRLLDYAPKQALVDVRDRDEVLNRFVTGSDKPHDAGRQTAAQRLRRLCRQVPWDAWVTPLWTWLPLALLAALASVCLAIMVHQQWSEHEHLGYPIAEFTTALLEPREGRPLNAIFYNRMFWIGFVVVFLIRINNGLCQWFPERLIPVQLRFDFTPLGKLWPWIMDVPFGGNTLLYVTVYPLVIAFAFFVSSEIALTLGLTQLLWVVIAAPMVKVGIDLTTDYVGGWSAWQRVGSYVAFGLMLLYAGRQYYRDMFVRAVAVWRKAAPANAAVWACRVFLLATVLMILLTMRLGLELPYAVGTVLLLLLSFVVVSRISAESGLFFIHARWQPFTVLLAMCGGYAMGPTSLVVSALVCMVLCFDHSQFLMAYLSNGLKIGEKLELSPAKVGSLTMGMYAVGALLATAVALCATYQAGTPTQCGWSYRQTPVMPYETADKEILRLTATGTLEQACELPWYRRLSGIHAKPSFIWAATFGFLGVLALSILRLRVTWWPLHPLLFLVWVTWPLALLWSSFLLGWLVKALSLRFGGFELVRKLRPLMIGIVAGEITAALAFMLWGAIYFATTGDKPVMYQFFPR